MSAKPLDAAALAVAHQELPDWRVSTDALIRQFGFADFATAMRFMTAASADIDALNHHPTWSNTYDQVEVTLKTHDADDRVTALDVQLAHCLERHARAIGLSSKR